MLEANKRRTGWIDICKALAIYCMVLVIRVHQIILATLYMCSHMPVFLCFRVIVLMIKTQIYGNLQRSALKHYSFLILCLSRFCFCFWTQRLTLMHRNSGN